MRWGLVMAALLLAAPARADTIAAGKVVKRDAREIYLNLGSRDGVTEGARLRIKRPIEVRHPVTRKLIRDWLPVGGADVSAVGARLSMARLDPEMLARVAVGDLVEIYVERDDAAEPPPPPDEPRDERPMPEVDADTQEVLAVWAAVRGKSLDARIAAWEGFLASRAGSAHAAAIREDLGTLRQLRDVLVPPSRTATRFVAGVEHAAPTQAMSGAPVPLVFVLADPAGVESAWLHFRAADAPTYSRALLVREGSYYLRGAIPAEAVAAPGVTYFVEVVGEDGEPGIAVAETTVEVDPPELAERFEPKRRRTRLAFVATYMDFSTFDDRTDVDHTDRVAQLETDVTYLIDGRLRALSAGLGILGGEGGFVDPPGPPAGPRPTIGYQYGYAEAEARVGSRIGVAARLIAGVDRTRLRPGGEARVRLGDPDATNLSLTLSQIGGVGNLSEVRLQVDPFGRAPVGLAVGVTDRPSQGDLAVRLAVDLGVRTLPWFEPVLRLSYQGRTVEHSGLGAGLGLAFHW